MALTSVTSINVSGRLLEELKRGQGWEGWVEGTLRE